MLQSKEQESIYIELSKIFGEENIIINYRPDKMKNDRTGRNLELDLYIKTFFIGFEYQSNLHFKTTLKTKGRLDYIQQNDEKKSRIIDDMQSKMRHLTLVELFKEDINDNIIDSLCDRIKKSASMYYIRNNNRSAKKLIMLYVILKSFREVASKIKIDPTGDLIMSDKSKEKEIKKEYNSIVQSFIPLRKMQREKKKETIIMEQKIAKNKRHQKGNRRSGLVGVFS